MDGRTPETVSETAATTTSSETLRRTVEVQSPLQDALAVSTPQPSQSLPAVSERMRSASLAGGALSARDVERILGTGNELVDINYLRRGVLASRMVAFVRTPEGTATGFLVGRQLLLTNWHVLKSEEVAAESSAIFDYELDLHGLRGQTQTFALRPDQGFWNSEALDYALVAVEASSSEGRSLGEWGFLRLSDDPHKTAPGLYVSIIGHPNGENKQIALRDNRVLQVGDSGEFPLLAKDDRLWYQTDTEPGNSGSPVLNDLWQVVGLHHAAIPRSREVTENGEQKTQYLLAPPSQDEWMDAQAAKRLRDDQLVWIANQGVRISRIVRHLRARQQTEPHPVLAAWVSDLDRQTPYPGTDAEDHLVTFEGFGSDDLTERRKTRPKRPPSPAPGGTGTDSGGRPAPAPGSYADRDGYNPDFLCVGVPLPRLDRATQRFGPAVTLTDASGTELRYRHFSVIMSEQRRIAFVTAVNIDGASSFDYPRNNDVWNFDPRIPADFQIGNPFYSNEPGAHGFFDRGHLVRRRDPIWGTGTVLKQANDDTFHWTNCSPQYWEFNQSDTLWQGLENFILNNSDNDDLKVSVFTGPIFDESDPVHRTVHIPQSFWKVVATCDAAGALQTSAYRVSQAPFVDTIPFEALPVGPFSTFQVAVSEIEEQTGLDFGETVRHADVFAGQQPRKLNRAHDLQRVSMRRARPQTSLPEVSEAVQSASPARLGVELEGGQVLYFDASPEQESQGLQRRELNADGGPLLRAGESFQGGPDESRPDPERHCRGHETGQ